MAQVNRTQDTQYLTGPASGLLVPQPEPRYTEQNSIIVAEHGTCNAGLFYPPLAEEDVVDMLTPPSSEEEAVLLLSTGLPPAAGTTTTTVEEEVTPLVTPLQTGTAPTKEQPLHLPEGPPPTAPLPSLMAPVAQARRCDIVAGFADLFEEGGASHNTVGTWGATCEGLPKQGKALFSSKLKPYSSRLRRCGTWWHWW